MMNILSAARHVLAVAAVIFMTAEVRGDTNRICFYVDKGVPGHCFVQLRPRQGPQAGALNLVYGKYPATRNIFGGAGVIKDDSKRAWDQRICYPVTIAQYNGAVTKIRGKLAAPPPYNLVRNPPGNCVNWMTDSATAAGLTLPNKIRLFGIATPGAFGRSLKNIGGGGVFMGGTVEINPNPGQSADGSPVALNPPHDWDAEETALASHVDPAGQAADMELLLTQQNLGLFSTTTADGMNIEVPTGDPDVSLMTVDWGDGSQLDGQQTSFTHFYAVDGLYDVSLTIIDHGALHHFTLQVEVGAGPVKNIALADPPVVRPNENPNEGFEITVLPEYICPIEPCQADIDEDGQVCQSDLGILLANFGSSFGVPSPENGDLNCDGEVDQEDLGILLGLYDCSGVSCP